MCSAPPLAGAAAPTEGRLAFPDPASAEAQVELTNAWWIRWLAPAAGPALDASTFQHAGKRIAIEYVERGNPLASNPSVQRAEFYDFELELVAEPGPQELVAHAGGAAGDRIESDSSWSLSTLRPLGLEAPGPRTPALEAVPSRALLLETAAARLTSQLSQETHFYGFKVILRHRDGVETYRTGLLGPALPASQAGLPVHDAYLRVRTEGADLQVAFANRPAQLMAPLVPLVGRITFDRVSGQLEQAGIAAQLHNDHLVLEGAYLFSTDAAAPADGDHHVAFAGANAASPAAGRADVPATPHSWIHPLVWTATGGLLLAAFALLRDRVAIAIATLFSRVERGRAAEHPLRRRLLELIRQDPGIGMEEAARRLGCGWGTLSYHVAVLEKFGRVRGRRFGARRSLFLMEAAPPGDLRAIALLRAESHRAVLGLVQAWPHLTQAQIGARVGVTQSAVCKILGRLKTAGLLSAAGPTP